MNYGKTNSQLRAEYLDIIAASKSRKWHLETKHLFGDFLAFLGEYPSTMELFTKFFQRYSTVSLSTRALRNKGWTSL